MVSSLFKVERKSPASQIRRQILQPPLIVSPSSLGPTACSHHASESGIFDIFLASQGPVSEPLRRQLN